VRDVVRTGLASVLNPQLVDELLEAHAEAKRNYFLGGLRLSEVEGGRFCEAAFRLLEAITTSRFTPLGRSLQTDRIIAALAKLPHGSYSDAVRLHIPRALRLIYDVRNNRDAAHLADGIDPNTQDATLVVSVADWVLAEFVRLYHNVPADDAQDIVEQIVTREAPVIQDFGGFLKVLRPDLKPAQHCMVLLYHRGNAGATYDELKDWARPAMQSNLRRTLRGIVSDDAFAHHDGQRYYITYKGQRYVERNKLIEPETL
jgi:hypothetical protein